MRRYRLWGFGIMALGVIGLLTWIDAWFISGWTIDLFRGIGVEILGALVTAVGIIGLEKLYAEPEETLVELRDEIKRQSTKIDDLYNQLQVTVCHLSENMKESVDKTYMI